MLNVNIYYEGNPDIETAFQKADFSKGRKGWFFEKKLSKKLESVLAEFHEETYSYQLTFSGSLTFEDYELIHEAIDILAKELPAEIDDKKALMGYLENGEKAFIYHQWKEWKAYLLQAKHVSMEGQKIEVKKGEDSWQGILLHYSSHIKNDKFRVTECTVLGTDGEVRVQGDELILTPRGEFL